MKYLAAAALLGIAVLLGAADCAHGKHVQKAPKKTSKQAAPAPAGNTKGDTTSEKGSDAAAKSNTADKNPETGVKIHYTKTGGFIGVDLATDIDSSKLPPKEAAELMKDLDKSGLLKVSKPEKIPMACDAFQYSFEATANGETHKAVFNDVNLPESYRPLVKFLDDRAVDMRAQRK